MKQAKLTLPIHILWYTNDYRKMIQTEDEREIEMHLKTPAKIDLPNKDTIYLKPIRIKSYATLSEAIQGDMETWRKLNK